MSSSPLIGLTGGIASGKSSVSRLFVARGAALVDADAIYHRLIAPQDHHPSSLARQIAAAFGDVLAADGSLRRDVLGRAVFADPKARGTLEQITHPMVRAQAEREIQAHRQAKAPLVLYDVPLLFERNLSASFDAVVVVWVSAVTQLERLMARDHLSIEDAKARLSAQWPLDRKADMATFVIDNDGPRDKTLAQVDTLWPQLTALTRAV